jgi:hypothetical protein
MKRSFVSGLVTFSEIAMSQYLLVVIDRSDTCDMNTKSLIKYVHKWKDPDTKQMIRLHLLGSNTFAAQ